MALGDNEARDRVRLAVMSVDRTWGDAGERRVDEANERGKELWTVKRRVPHIYGAGQSADEARGYRRRHSAASVFKVAQASRSSRVPWAATSSCAPSPGTADVNF